jgi:2-keto-4-pentenoate hydratase/2-oxohepta-3-ene-1,7-dioic acid hydratase in catechol pathway
MKIFGIGRNYAAHIEELNNERPAEPVIFIMPETALLLKNRPFYYPSFSIDIHYEVEIVLKISKVGKNIDEKFAHTYYDEIGLGIDFTARDLQQKAKEKGLPWAIAKGFNDAAPLSEFVAKNDYDLNNLAFSLTVDGEIKQQGNTKLMLFSFDYIISYLSKFFLLKKGDLIFTGTPKGVGPVNIGNRLEAFLGTKKMLHVDIK